MCRKLNVKSSIIFQDDKSETVYEPDHVRSSSEKRLACCENAELQQGQLKD